jgi:hypothetical protein
MAKGGTWGTEMEIYALATLLQTQIAVFYRPPGSRLYDWYFYPPIHVDMPDTSALSVYLYNKGDHFDRVITVGPIPSQSRRASAANKEISADGTAQQHQDEEGYEYY